MVSLTHRAISGRIYKRFVCPWCGKPCKTLYNLKVHAQTHFRRGPFRCPACGREFGSGRELRTHIRFSAIWCWRHGLRHPEAKMHMALAYLALSPKRTTSRHQPLRPVWREEAYEAFGEGVEEWP